ncbi:hypothetical protein C7K38_07950 [Tetragenococcus osmophilus]|uniref:Cyclophilin-like domain-containing protein n=1 Tax=Tetragenococcus osmophilus TaxID=526944 RepID=A0AA38CXX5_9ENTE|nr:cyclophilin-like fold protein [Tetragenococcus osmophilus]AYW48297.1 hypothetical protein C7K38_07950 [Tetragenococcus osmophilus]GMA54104.1 hypothetical protein GCM10025857_54610 [Alicyclobacillus contaminans]GMA72009.1 hypothetical protein GCM10025885_10580 [Tetragenococcus osmophilus]
MKKYLWVFLLSLFLLNACSTNDADAPSNNQSSESSQSTTNGVVEDEEETEGQMTVTINDEEFQATLYDNETTEAFKELLPLDITMDDFNSNEKEYQLEEPLPTNEQSVGSIQTGDLMLYGSNTLVLFYDDFSTSYSYTRLGTLDNPEDLEETVGSDSATVDFQLNN